MADQVYHDTWDWSYPPARIQLKAMARLLFLSARRPLPLHPVSPQALDAVRTGRHVPFAFVQSPGPADASLEDYGLAPGQSVESKEAEELPAVLRYIDENGLVAVAERLGRAG